MLCGLADPRPERRREGREVSYWDFSSTQRASAPGARARGLFYISPCSLCMSVTGNTGRNHPFVPGVTLGVVALSGAHAPCRFTTRMIRYLYSYPHHKHRLMEPFSLNLIQPRSSVVRTAEVFCSFRPNTKDLKKEETKVGESMCWFPGVMVTEHHRPDSEGLTGRRPGGRDEVSAGSF